MPSARKSFCSGRRTFPQAQTVRLPTVGHYVQEEAPDALGNAVDAFLAK
ncbi:MAG: hypothetical protein R2873_20485 [Caldilineaceae bacterium]